MTESHFGGLSCSKPIIILQLQSAVCCFCYWLSFTVSNKMIILPFKTCFNGYIEILHRNFRT